MQLVVRQVVLQVEQTIDATSCIVFWPHTQTLKISIGREDL